MRLRVIATTLAQIFVLLVFLVLAGRASAQPATTRELERMNWMEFRELVPKRIDTVLVPLGTLEPHGVTANGADSIAPLAIARAIAPKVNALIAPVVPYGITGSMDPELSVALEEPCREK
jgi:creatinine amidohydrolase